MAVRFYAEYTPQADYMVVKLTAKDGEGNQYGIEYEAGGYLRLDRSYSFMLEIEDENSLFNDFTVGLNEDISRMWFETHPHISLSADKEWRAKFICAFCTAALFDAENVKKTFKDMSVKHHPTNDRFELIDVISQIDPRRYPLVNINGIEFIDLLETHYEVEIIEEIVYKRQKNYAALARMATDLLDAADKSLQIASALEKSGVEKKGFYLRMFEALIPHIYNAEMSLRISYILAGLDLILTLAASDFDYMSNPYASN